MKRIFEKGECVYQSPSVPEIKEYCEQQLETIWEEVKRFEYPHKYYVDLSQQLWSKKDSILREIYGRVK